MSSQTAAEPTEPVLPPLPETLKADPAYADLAAVLRPSKYMLVLCAPGNPDHRQYACVAAPQVVAVDTVAAAKKHCEAYRNENDLGGGNWGCGCGNLYDRASNVVVGMFSYNARFWPTASLYTDPEAFFKPEQFQELPERRLTGMDALLRKCRQKSKLAKKGTRDSRPNG